VRFISFVFVSSALRNFTVTN